MLKALAAEGGPTTPAQLDRMLLAVERARYAAEALTRLIGRPARRYTARVAKLQRLLQDRRDQLLIQESLVGLSEKARRAGEDTFDYGRLHAHLDRVPAERDELGRTFDARLDDSVARVERRAARLLRAPAGPLGDRATI
jgi:CHAD domain-containing protein